MVLFLSYVYSKQPIFGLTQEWFRELSFSRLECGVHDKLHISSAYSYWWDILLPLAWTPDRRDRRLLASPSKDTGQSAVNGIAKVQKRSCRCGIKTQDHPVAVVTHSANVTRYNFKVSVTTVRSNYGLGSSPGQHYPKHQP